MKAMKVAGKALSPLFVLGVLIAMAALVTASVGLYAIIDHQELDTTTINNPAHGLTVTMFGWTNGGEAYDLGSGLTLGVMYQFGVNLASTGSYKDVSGVIEITKTNCNYGLAATDVDIDIYYNGVWHNNVAYVITGNVGTITLDAMNIPIGTSASFLVGITYMSTGDYKTTVTANGYDA